MVFSHGCWTNPLRQPFRVIRGMDYMYNQQQAKAMRMALDAGGGLWDLGGWSPQDIVLESGILEMAI